MTDNLLANAVNTITITSQNSEAPVQVVDLVGSVVLPARAGERYQIVDSSGANVDNLVALRVADNLEVRLADGTVLIIQDYYIVCGQQQCGITLAGDTADGVELLAEEGIPAAAKAADGEQGIVVYSHGSVADVMAELTANGEVITALADSAAPDDNGADNNDTAASDDGIATSTWLLGGLGVLGVAGLASGGSGGSGSSGGSSEATVPGAADEPVTAAPVSEVASAKAATYQLSVNLGPVLADNTELTIKLYRGDGSLLGETGTYDASIAGFSFTDNTGYFGVVVTRLIDAGDGADYLDEATGSPQDAPNDLISVGYLGEGSSELALTISPLTAIAAAQAGVAIDGDSVSGAEGLTAAAIDAVNTSVAQAFGIVGGNWRLKSRN
jgi:hypothetical protein